MGICHKYCTFSFNYQANFSDENSFFLKTSSPSTHNINCLWGFITFIKHLQPVLAPNPFLLKCMTRSIASTVKDAKWTGDERVTKQQRYLASSCLPGLSSHHGTHPISQNKNNPRDWQCGVYFHHL